jgi:hypothetical protein
MFRDNITLPFILRIYKPVIWSVLTYAVEATSDISKTQHVCVISQAEICQSDMRAIQEVNIYFGKQL